MLCYVQMKRAMRILIQKKIFSCAINFLDSLTNRTTLLLMFALRFCLRVWTKRRKGRILNKRNEQVEEVEKNGLVFAVFLINNNTSVYYYKRDQTRNYRTYCAIFFSKKYTNVHHTHSLFYEQDE